jgi:hypothetical protein
MHFRQEAQQRLRAAKKQYEEMEKALKAIGVA